MSSCLDSHSTSGGGRLICVKAGAGEKHTLTSMKAFVRSSAIVAIALGIAFAAPAAAQQSATVAGTTVNLGIVPAEVALRADGHRDSHPTNPPPGSQHLMITLDDQKSGKRVGDADVTVEVTDPRGRVERKPLLHTQGGGLPDYSELFEFRWTGKYTVRVVIAPKGAKPIETSFTVNHSV
jgi:hypothetical protein